MPASPNTITLSATHRWAIEDEIDRLIAILDAVDGDTDLEPSLGLNGLWHPIERRDWIDVEGDDCDDEPSLGSREITCQRDWAGGGRADLELDNCDDEQSDNGIGDQGALAEIFGGVS